MKFVALVSGGKDSIFSILEAQREGHELVACVHLGRPQQEDEESYMYQTAGSEVVQTLVEECIQVPLILHVRTGKSVQTSLVYEETKPEDDAVSSADEVEDLYLALQEAVNRFPSVQAVASGALLSTYQRVRIENVCQRLSLTSLSYLWRRGSQHDILRAMIHQAGLEAVLVRTAAPPGLLPRKHLNKSLMALEAVLYTLYDRYRMHVCGEGGEYESLCLFAPGLYRKRLVLDEVEIRLDENDDTVGILVIKSCYAQELDEQEMQACPPRKAEDESDTELKPTRKPSATASTSHSTWIPPPARWLPRVRRCEGGLWQTSGIVSPKSYPASSSSLEADLAVQEARDVLFVLQKLLDTHQCTAHDVGMVHLYLSDISHFAKINQYYRQCFGVLLPPSRSCVALGNLPMQRRVMLDCWVLAGSGEYMRLQGVMDQKKKAIISPYAKSALMNTSVRYRQVLHVQSLSHWAPVCVGPYSQANTVFGAIHFLAGSIGLRPASMTLRESWTLQLEQSWKNIAQILDALDQSSMTDSILSGMVYISDQIYSQDMGATRAQLLEISNRAISTNSGIIAGLVDDTVSAGNLHGGYEDEETRLEVEGLDMEAKKRSTCPLLMVALAAMPVGAEVEVEIVAAARATAGCLPVTDHHGSLREKKDRANTPTCKSWKWDAGYDFDGSPSGSSITEIDVVWSLRTLGVSGSAYATVVAFSQDDGSTNGFDADEVMQLMFAGLETSLSKTAGSVRFETLLSCRIYYASAANVDHTSTLFDPSSRLEAAFNAALPKQAQPALTVVPVCGMEYIDSTEPSQSAKPILALQATFVDPVCLQSELWIRQGRSYE